MVGESWTGSGSVNALDDNGMMLALSMAEVVYIELGPAMFWQEMEPALAVGDFVTVNGFYNGEQYHAATVTTANGEKMELRTELGQPLWAGNDSQNADGTTTEPQVAADEWVRFEGVVSSYGGSMMTMETTEGELLDLQLGQKNFVESQGITFTVGEDIGVLGYWQGSAFKAGEITKTATGERLMLLDPNGRPLWGGPGRNGASGQNQSQNTAQTTTQTQISETAQNQSQASNQGSQGQGSQGQGSQGQGNQGQGGQGQGGQGQGNQKQDVEVPATQWETLEGTVTLVDELAVTVELDGGSEAVVALGQVDFWTDEGYWFEYGEDLLVEGYWVNGEFQAGFVSWTGTEYEITIRDEYGRLLWVDTGSSSGQGNGGQGNSSSGGGGNGYQGGRNSNFTNGNGGGNNATTY